MKRIKITHQESNLDFHFKVKNPKELSNKEVKHICKKMSVQALFIEGKYYKL